MTTGTPGPDAPTGTTGRRRSASGREAVADLPSRSIEEIREIYRGRAPIADRLDPLNRAITGRYRRRLFGTARRRVLDVACGVGTNARYLPDRSAYVGVDLSADMLARARMRLADRPRETSLHQMDAQALAFSDGCFDTVISSLSTCTFPDPVAALSEMGRVCAPDGRVLLVEHGRSSLGPIARLQEWRARAHLEKHGCRLTQDPLEVVSRSPLTVLDATAGLLGTLTAIAARPG